MSEIIIDEEFKRLLPALDEQTYAWLENNILDYGCREPIVLWNGIIIDGHNRYDILTKHGLPVNIVRMEFDSRDEVIIWIISTQISRRNLNAMELSNLRGLHYNTEKRVVGNPDWKIHQQDELAQNEPIVKPQSTASRLSEKYNISRATIKRDSQIANALDAINEISPEIKADILSGKTRISRNQLQELSSGTTDDVAAVVSQIINGTLEHRKVAEKQTEWEKQFSAMTNEFKKLARVHAQLEDTLAMKTALKRYIGMLEELYAGM